MLRIILTCLLLQLSISLSAQPYPQIQNTFALQPCPYNDSIEVLTSSEYDFYQTLNNEFDGPIDSSWCPNFTLSGGDYYLDLTDFDTLRSLFIRRELPVGQGQNIEPYTNHFLSQNMWLDDAVLDVSQDSCGGEICNGFILETFFADEVTTSSGERNFSFELTEEYPELSGGACFFSERFSLQSITALTLKMTFSFTGNTPRLTPYQIGVEEGFYDYDELESITFGPQHYNGEIYMAYLEEVAATNGSNDWLYYVPQVSDLLPGPENFNNLDVNLSPNVDSQQTLVINLFSDAMLRLPPYTGIQGGLVGGEDSLRHNLLVEVYDDFFNNCFFIIVEIVANPGVSYRFNGGTLALANSTSCLRLEPEGRIMIAEDKDFTYGNNGSATGLFATKDNSWVVLEPNSTFTFNSNWQLAHRPGIAEAGAHVELSEGSQLIFGEKSSLYRSHPEGLGHLYLHMNGGSADLSALSAEERQLIRFIYPPKVAERTGNASEELLVYPNPFQQRIQCVVPDVLTGKHVNYQLTDLSGKVVQTGVTTPTGKLIAIDVLESLAAGVYHVRLSSDSYNASGRMVKARR